MPKIPNATSPAASPQNDSSSSLTSTTRSPLRTVVVILAVGLIVGVQLFGHRLGPLYSSLVTELSSSSSLEQQEEFQAQHEANEPSVAAIAAADGGDENQRLEGFLHRKNNDNTNIKNNLEDNDDKGTTAAEIVATTTDTGGATILHEPAAETASSDKGQSSPADSKMENDGGNDNVSAKKKKPLNVIIFYPDDWRHDDLGGVAPVVRTPFLNELAQQGIRFTHNAVTTSICWISRATLFTGQYASRHKSLRLRQPYFYDDWYNTSWPALLQRFKSYWVGHVGKWQFVNRGGIVQKSLFNWTNLHEGAHWYKGQPAANFSRDAALQFLRERPRHHNHNGIEEPTPFALTVAFYPPKAVTLNPAPGAQWTPSRHFYENDTIPNPPYNITESYLKLPWFFHTDEKYGRDWWSKRFQTTEQYQRGMKNYYSLITEVDQACREIVDELKNQQILEDTLLIFTTDNGLFHSEHGLVRAFRHQHTLFAIEALCTCLSVFFLCLLTLTHSCLIGRQMVSVSRINTSPIDSTRSTDAS